MNREDGYFILDALGAVFLLVAMTASMAYVTGQLSDMKELEGIVTAECMVREQLDRLCVEQRQGDLGTGSRRENGYEIQLLSSKENTGIQGLVRYRVQAEWQTGQGVHHFALEKEVSDGTQ
ncbi:hypothetical protein [Anaerovibrio sp.]|uniref:hypothetical protein n=1 Tax=Anaerovibrio sp. TaxID=1872532 RepID=UPI003F1655C5